MVIIGGGIAGLCTAYEASKRRIESLILDSGLPGTTHSATGILDARADHLPYDEESVIRTAYEVVEWRKNFPFLPVVIKPKHFLMPLGPNAPHSAWAFGKLLSYYEKTAKARLCDLPQKHSLIPVSFLERMEPNLKKNYFQGAFKFWLWTADPDALMRKVYNETALFSPYSRKLSIKNIVSMEVQNRTINKLYVLDRSGEVLEISNDFRPLIVVNASGAWINETAKLLGMNLGVQFQLGVQASVPGYFFQSGIINFAKNGKYIILLQDRKRLQIGPTNSEFVGKPGAIGKRVEDTNRLAEVLNDTLEDRIDPRAVTELKSGLRIKPSYVFDTDRPIIWSHHLDGVDNFYTLLPGKMALGLLAARELMGKMERDRWICPAQFGFEKKLSLDGQKKYRNQLKLLAIRLRSLFKLALFFIRSLFAIKNPKNH